MPQNRRDRFVPLLLVCLLVAVLAVTVVPYGLKLHHASLGKDLVEAIQKGDMNRVQSLLNQGVDPNVADDTDAGLHYHRLTALDWALQTQHPQAAVALLKHGAHWSSNVVAQIAREADPTLAFALIERGGNANDLLQMAVANGNTSLVQALLAHYPDLKQMVKGEPLLLDAATRGNLPLIQVLVDNGAPINAHDDNDVTPLMRAVMSRQIEVVRFLLAHGADRQARSRQGYTALGYAELERAPEVAQLLRPLDVTASRTGAAGGAQPQPDYNAFVATQLATQRQAIAKNPADAEAHFQVAGLLMAQGKVGEAISEYRQMVKLRPKDPDPHVFLGYALARHKQIPDAIAEYRKALALDPKSLIAGKALADTLWSEGKREEALAEYQRIAQVNPQDSNAQARLGLALLQLRHGEAAIHQFRQALSLFPRIAYLHADLSSVLWQQGQRQEALAEQQKAVQLESTYAPWHDTLSYLLYSLGKKEESIAESRQALQIDPNDGAAYVNLGWTLLELGKTDEAVTACWRAVQLRPSDANAHANLGKALTAQGKLKDALHECNVALQLNPRDAEARYDLGLAQEKSGQQEQARATFQAYLHMAQGNPAERERIADAERRLQP